VTRPCRSAATSKSCAKTRAWPTAAPSSLTRKASSRLWKSPPKASAVTLPTCCARSRLPSTSPLTRAKSARPSGRKAKPLWLRPWIWSARSKNGVQAARLRRCGVAIRLGLLIYSSYTPRPRLIAPCLGFAERLGSPFYATGVLNDSLLARRPGAIRPGVLFLENTFSRGTAHHVGRQSENPFEGLPREGHPAVRDRDRKST